MIVHQPHSLHPRIHDGWTHELEAPRFEFFRDRPRQWRSNWNRPFVLNRLPINEAPSEIGELDSALMHVEVDPSSLDRRLDLGTASDDSWILKLPGDIFLAQTSYLLRIEVAERLAKRIALAEHDD